MDTSERADNPLINGVEAGTLPDFNAITPEHAEPAVEALIADAEQVVAGASEVTADNAWTDLIDPLIHAQDRLERTFGPVSHMNAVMDSPNWRDAYQACIARITNFSTNISQNTALYQAVDALYRDSAFTNLDHEQQRVVEHWRRDFELAGVGLADDIKARYKTIATELSSLSTTFSQNVLDATQAWQKQITDETALAGLPESARNLLAQNASNKSLDGWLITLDGPSVQAVLTHADERELRREVYTAFTTRASDAGPNAGSHDNSTVMAEILALRQEAAGLLGFTDHAERSLATKMADSPAQIESFLGDLATRSRPHAESELAELRELAHADGIDTLQSWDVGYYAERLKQRRFDVSDEDLKPWLSAPAVLDGLFHVVQQLYGVVITPRDDISTWHPDVRVFDIADADGQVLGTFYLDAYAREHKRGGAWVDPFQSRRRQAGDDQRPAAFVTCNFAPPIGDDPALLSHTEVVTLFHEFGHALHHLLTRVEQAPIAGIAGVEWDAVELPSQFMENFCWQREALGLFATHYQTGEALPADMFARLAASRTHMAGWQTLRQIEFSLFDLRLHRDTDPDPGSRVQSTLDAVRDEVAVLRPPADNRFAHGFAHIFAGPYAAGYYSYKWAEVLAADAFGAFEAAGVLDRNTGTQFKREILERGASRDAADNFAAFRGREPSIDALLRQNGLTTDHAA
ncbi:M3 family metallopeptidase [Salinisphaera sp. USBA-960]|uniref:M3 family metallopeptidase n=1 Tax=Salinisphaera orenii TaxID=856731 RepID=UPI000DBE2F59|nr:M3 family metallopeptidase [Salifodinibacter halophilus]NNC25400.1 M3 family metallopeptidase [Salifodinibacter halophilus]